MQQIFSRFSLTVNDGAIRFLLQHLPFTCPGLRTF